MIYNLKNGQIINIPDKEGAYILSTGCGSGKTTLFKEIIKGHWSEGILYSVDSRQECRNMYKWIIDNLVAKPEIALKSSDIMMLYSKESNDPYEIEMDSTLNLYKQDPTILLRKKILIITHPRLFAELPGYFLVHNENLNTLPPFDGNFKKLMTRSDLRKYILIDETPQFFKPLATFRSWIAPLMNGKNKAEVKGIYDTWLKGKEDDPFKGPSTAINHLKRDAALDILPSVIPQWNSHPKESKFSIQFYPKDLCQDGMKTKVLVAEGCGDILFSGQKNYQLLDIEKKYRSKIELQSFSFSLRRDVLPGILQRQTLLNTLKGIIDKEPGGCLIVVWKNFKGASEQDESSDEDGSNESKWRNTIKSELLGKGVPPESFAVTYYGASDTKSTNNYRDFKTIICCGKWYLPASCSRKIDEGYGGSCCSDDYNLYQYVQLVSRIGLRMNTGDKYKMYYSEDFLDSKGVFSLGNRLCEYINNNKLTPTMTNRQRVTEMVKDLTKSNKIIKGVETLIDKNYLDTDMFKSGKTIKVEIQMKDISSLIPYRDKRVSNYDPLCRVLSMLDITLIVKKKR